MRQGHLDDMRDVATKSELMSAFLRAGEALGFPLGGIVLRSGHFDSSPNFNGLHNPPPQWVERSKDLSLAMVDPVFQRLNTAREPFFYDADFYGSRNAGPLWEECAPYGYRNGVAASLHVSSTRAIFWSFDRHEAVPSDERRRMELLASVQLLGVFGSIAVERVLGPQRPPLTERQMEILRLVRAGHSSWVISSLTGIAEETVNYHLKNIRAIFRVRTRVQAIDKAVELGLLD